MSPLLVFLQEKILNHLSILRRDRDKIQGCQAKGEADILAALVSETVRGSLRPWPGSRCSGLVKEQANLPSSSGLSLLPDLRGLPRCQLRSLLLCDSPQLWGCCCSSARASQGSGTMEGWLCSPFQRRDVVAAAVGPVGWKEGPGWGLEGRRAEGASGPPPLPRQTTPVRIGRHGVRRKTERQVPVFCGKWALQGCWGQACREPLGPGRGGE